MSTKQAPELHVKTASEVRTPAVSFDNDLESGESFTGSPTVAVSPAGPTIANEAVSTAALTISGQSVAAGRAIQFKISGGTAATRYTITVSCGTDASPAQTLYGHCIMDVIAD